jgi:hypothetical protein
VICLGVISGSFNGPGRQAHAGWMKDDGRRTILTYWSWRLGRIRKENAHVPPGEQLSFPPTRRSLDPFNRTVLLPPRRHLIRPRTAPFRTAPPPTSLLRLAAPLNHALARGGGGSERRLGSGSGRFNRRWRRFPPPTGERRRQAS